MCDLDFGGRKQLMVKIEVHFLVFFILECREEDGEYGPLLCTLHQYEAERFDRFS